MTRQDDRGQQRVSRRGLLAGLAAGTLVSRLRAEGRKRTDNPKSPSAETSATVGKGKVTIEYNAPSLRGRKAFGGDLVPYGQVWRTGADAATTMETTSDLMIGSTRVPKGTYTLYTLPEQGKLTLVVNKQTGQWGTDYDEKQDLARIPMTVTTLSQPVEKFAIRLQPKGANQATLEMAWERTQASVPVKAV